MDQLEIKKRIKRIIFLTIFLLLLSFAWWGPYKDHIRIKKSLSISFPFNKNIV